MKTRTLFTLFTSLIVAAPALGQSNISPTDKRAWGENIGWTNWRDANAAANGAVVGPSFLSGFVWGENAGWISLGDGAPTNGVSYANVDGSDFGVNVLADGALDGLAWGENIGWVNFGTTPFVGADGARVEGGRLRGYAWGENAGWINLDDGAHFVGLNCPADFDNDGAVNGADLATLLTNWNGPGGLPDLNGDGIVDGADLAGLLTQWGACP